MLFFFVFVFFCLLFFFLVFSSFVFFLFILVFFVLILRDVSSITFYHKMIFLFSLLFLTKQCASSKFAFRLCQVLEIVILITYYMHLCYFVHYAGVLACRFIFLLFWFLRNYASSLPTYRPAQQTLWLAILKE